MLLLRDTQKKMLEWIEIIVTTYNGTGAAFLVAADHCLTLNEGSFAGRC
jgi:hypothetical protein